MKLKKVIASLAVSIAVLGAGATSVFATTEYVGGGTWNYGTNDTTVWSNYYHGSKIHRSSVIGAYYYNSGWKSPGVWSYASAPERDGVVDESFWDVY